MRTQDEITARIKAREEADPFGFERGAYVVYLDYKHVQPYLRAGVTEEEWQSEEETPVEIMHDYMHFAWGKANDCRGLSANRSIMHCIAWLWLAEEDELLAHVEHEYNTNYCYYGKPILEMICDHFGWDWSAWDDGVRTNGE